MPVFCVAGLVVRAVFVLNVEDKYTIWVKIRNNRKEVFRAKFLIVSLPEERNQENENRS